MFFFVVVFLFFLVLVGTVNAVAIIADHNAVKEFDQIPPYWLEKAKELTTHFAHASYSDQINEGLAALENLNSSYSFSRRVDQTPGLPPVESLPALRMYDGNGGMPSNYWM